MTKDEISVRLFELKIAHVQHLLDNKYKEQSLDREQNILLIVLLKQHLRELRRQKIEKWAATLDDLAQMKIGVRVGDLLLDSIKDNAPEAELRGYTYGSYANKTHSDYSFVHELAFDLGKVIATVEARDFPEFKDWFNAERAEYRRLIEQECHA